MTLDRYDEKILAMLVQDARASVSDISRQVNLSRSAVSERIKRMEESGKITGYHAHIALTEDNQISAYLALTFRPLSCELVQPYVEQIPEIKMAHSISGDIDLMILVQVASMKRLHEIRLEMDNWPNIDKVVTHMCLATRVERL